MFSKFGFLVLIVLGYVYLTSNDCDKTLYTKTKNVCCKYYKDVQKDVQVNDFKVKADKPVHKERRFFLVSYLLC